jgi:hypothetical protein
MRSYIHYLPECYSLVSLIRMKGCSRFLLSPFLWTPVVFLTDYVTNCKQFYKKWRAVGLNLKRHWPFTLRLLTGYKMYPGLEFSWTFLAGTEKQSYQFFYLFIEVPLTQHNHHSAHILFFTCGMFLSNQTGPFCTHVSKKVPNTCFAKTYYINRLTRTNCKRVTTSNPTAQLTN